MDRRTFAKAFTGGALTAMGLPSIAKAEAHGFPRPAMMPAWIHKAVEALPPNIVTRIRIFDPPNPNRRVNSSNLVVMVDTESGITGIGEGGSRDLIDNLARSVIGKNAFNTELIWQYMYMDAFYSPGREKIHAMGAIDLALWDIKAKALGIPLYHFFGGQVRDHVELYSTPGLPAGVVPPGEAAGMSLSERAAATMAAGYRVYRVDAEGTGPYGQAGIFFGGPPTGRLWDARARIPAILDAAAEIREGIGRDGNWMIDLHQKFDYQDSVEVCRGLEQFRPYMAEDPLREEQFLTQIPKLRMMTSCPLAPGEQWGQRWTFNTLVENRDIDFIRATLPNVGGITEMLKIMAICETHTVGIVPHFTGPIATAALVHVLTAFPGLALMEFNLAANPPQYLPELVTFNNGKLWPNERPGIGVTIEPSLLTFREEWTEGPAGSAGSTYRRPDGSPTHW